MKRVWDNKKFRYISIGIAGILLVALLSWLVLRPKPVANYTEFLDKFNSEVEAGGGQYHIDDYTVEGRKSFTRSGARLTLNVSHGKLMNVSITNPDLNGSDSAMESFVVYAAASAKALGISSDALLGVVTQSIKAHKDKSITYGDYKIATENIFSTSFSIVSVTVSHK